MFSSCQQTILNYVLLPMHVLFVCVGALMPTQQFFSHVGMIFCLPGLNQYYKQQIKYLAQGQNTMTPVSIKLATLDPQSNTLQTEPHAPLINAHISPSGIQVLTPYPPYNFLKILSPFYICCIYSRALQTGFFHGSKQYEP